MGAGAAASTKALPSETRTTRGSFIRGGVLPRTMGQLRRERKGRARSCFSMPVILSGAKDPLRQTKRAPTQWILRCAQDDGEKIRSPVHPHAAHDEARRAGVHEAVGAAAGLDALVGEVLGVHVKLQVGVDL